MPTLTKHASVPATLNATAHLSDGTAVNVTGAGTWTKTDAEIAVLRQCYCNVGGTLYACFT